MSELGKSEQTIAKDGFVAFMQSQISSIKQKRDLRATAKKLSGVTKFPELRKFLNSVESFIMLKEKTDDQVKEKVITDLAFDAFVAQVKLETESSAKEAQYIEEIIAKIPKEASRAFDFVGALSSKFSKNSVVSVLKTLEGKRFREDPGFLETANQIVDIVEPKHTGAALNNLYKVCDANQISFKSIVKSGVLARIVNKDNPHLLEELGLLRVLTQRTVVDNKLSKILQNIFSKNPNEHIEDLRNLAETFKGNRAFEFSPKFIEPADTATLQSAQAKFLEVVAKTKDPVDFKTQDFVYSILKQNPKYLDEKYLDRFLKIIQINIPSESANDLALILRHPQLLDLVMGDTQYESIEQIKPKLVKDIVRLLDTLDHQSLGILKKHLITVSEFVDVGEEYLNPKLDNRIVANKVLLIGQFLDLFYKDAFDQRNPFATNQESLQTSLRESGFLQFSYEKLSVKQLKKVLESIIKVKAFDPSVLSMYVRFLKDFQPEEAVSAIQKLNKFYSQKTQFFHFKLKSELDSGTQYRLLNYPAKDVLMTLQDISNDKQSLSKGLQKILNLVTSPDLKLDPNLQKRFRERLVNLNLADTFADDVYFSLSPINWDSKIPGMPDKVKNIRDAFLNIITYSTDDKYQESLSILSLLDKLSKQNDIGLLLIDQALDLIKNDSLDNYLDINLDQLEKKAEDPRLQSLFRLIQMTIDGKLKLANLSKERVNNILDNKIDLSQVAKFLEKPSLDLFARFANQDRVGANFYWNLLDLNKEFSIPNNQWGDSLIDHIKALVTAQVPVTKIEGFIKHAVDKNLTIGQQASSRKDIIAQNLIYKSALGLDHDTLFLGDRAVTIGSGGLRSLSDLYEESSLNFARLDTPPVSSRDYDAIKAKTMEIYRSVFDFHYGFGSLAYEARRNPQRQDSLLLRLIRDIGKRVGHVNASHFNEFPGKGFILSGIDMVKVLGFESIENNEQQKIFDDLFQEYKNSLPWLKQAFNDVSSTMFVFTRGAIVVVPPEHDPAYSVRNINGDYESHSLIIYNDHFENNGTDVAHLVPTKVIKEKFQGAVIADEDFIGFNSSKKDINQVSLKPNTIKKGIRDDFNVLNLGWASNLGGSMSNAYPVKSAPYHEWETRVGGYHTKDIYGHIHKTHIADKYENNFNVLEKNPEFMKLQEANKDVHRCSKNLFNLMNVFQLAQSLHHKGFTHFSELESLDEKHMDDEVEYIDETDPSNDPDALSENPNTKHMLFEAYRWHRALMSKARYEEKRPDPNDFPVLALVPTFSWSSGPKEQIYFDSYDLTLKVKDGDKYKDYQFGQSPGEQEEFYWNKYFFSKLVDLETDAKLFNRQMLDI